MITIDKNKILNRIIYLMLISLNAKIGFMLDGLVYGTVIWGILNLLKVV